VLSYVNVTPCSHFINDVIIDVKTFWHPFFAVFV